MRPQELVPSTHTCFIITAVAVCYYCGLILQEDRLGPEVGAARGPSALSALRSLAGVGDSEFPWAVLGSDPESSGPNPSPSLALPAATSLLIPRPAVLKPHRLFFLCGALVQVPGQSLVVFL